MAEFLPPYYYPMDKEYETIQEETRLEEPIYPISQIGATVPEQDPAGRFKNMIQGIQANIRRGIGQMQVMWMTPLGSPIGGRPKAYGEEVREAIREIAKANQVEIGGFEMHTGTVSNMSGFDPQRFEFSNERQQEVLEEVKDAIKFAADTAQGGGVDMVSMEFPREINDADWNKDGTFFKVGEHRIGALVDDRNGTVQRFRKDEILKVPKRDDEGNVVMQEGRPVLETWDWGKFENEAKRRGVTPEEVFISNRLDAQINNIRGSGFFSLGQAEDLDRASEKIGENISEAEQKIKEITDAKERAEAQKELDRTRRMKENYEERAKSQREAAAGNFAQAHDLEETKKHLKPMSKFAAQRSVDGYAKAGIMAAMETQNNKYAKRDVYVGPEIGWPQFYGGHPDEFKTIIKQARTRMKQILENPLMTDAEGEFVDEHGKATADPNLAAKNPYYNPAMAARADELAKRHIKGMFDTGHLGMWLANFPAKPGESEEARVGRFNEWFKKKTRELASDPDQVVGGIQLVDSASAAHGHLPPGQGIFPIKEVAKIFKDNNYSGYLVSEGHEEEKFGEGRIVTKTWEELGSPIGHSYFGTPPGRSWGSVQGGYFGRTYSPMMLMGAYAPSNEFKLWSEVPFE